jgi:hypothetical protein
MLGQSEIYLADRTALKRYNELLAKFKKQEDTAYDLRQLLHHPDPKVRLLAIMAAFDKGAAEVLPEIDNQVTDNAVAYPDPPPDEILLRGSGVGPPHEPNTVAAVVADVVRVYLKPEEFREDLQEYYKPTYLFADSDITFAKCWINSSETQRHSSGFMLRYTRAIEIDYHHVTDQDIAKVHAIRADIDKLPEAQKHPILRRIALFERLNYGGPPIIVNSDEFSKIFPNLSPSTGP